jgi:anti-anti-sigma factor
VAEYPAVEKSRINPDAGNAFGITTQYTGRQVVVALRGEVDQLTAPTFASVLDALIDAGRRDIAVDVAELDFMDASGLGVIGPMSCRLHDAGGVLTIRSPSPIVRQILDITEMGDLIERRSPDPTPATLGPEQHTGDASRPVTNASPETDNQDAVQLPVFPVGNDVIDAALRLVTALARATIRGADGVSVSLTRHGQLTTVAASDETIAQMDRDQYSTGEGPCLSAAAEGHWFHAESLVEESRWSQFVPRAITGGIASILATPLIVSGRSLGSLNIYSNTDHAFRPVDQELAALFASQASSILAEARTDMTTEQVAGQLREALTTRQVIAQAQGVIMGRQGISANAAYATLRQSAKRTGVDVREHAAVVLASALRDNLIGQVRT